MKNNFYAVLIIVLSFFAVTGHVYAGGGGTTITVTTDATGLNDSDGACSFEEALSNANQSDTVFSENAGECGPGSSDPAAVDTINFDIPGSGTHVIHAPEGLTYGVNQPVVIDGTTQSGMSCGIRPDLADPNHPSPRNLLIEFDGSNYVQPDESQTPPFFSFNSGSDGSTIKGVAIYGNPVAQNVRIDTSNNTFTCDNIGTEGTGMIAKGGNQGIDFFGGTTKSGNVVGGTNAGDFNIISGNIAGGITVDEGTSGTQIIGNLIGLNATGNVAMGSQYVGEILINGSSTVDNTIVGGTTPEAKNFFGSSSPSSFGTILIQGSSNTKIMGNSFGVGTDGSTNTVASGSPFGITVVAANNILIGKFDGVGASNTIAHFNFAGITTVSNSTGIISKNTITQNGTGLNGAGIVIGSIQEIPGIPVVALFNNSIFGNNKIINIVSNISFGALSNSLSNRNTHVNDYLDGDTGPNNFLNHPVLISATQSGSDTIVKYMLDVPVGTYITEFYKNPSGYSDQGFGEGEISVDYDGPLTITTPGPQIFTKTLADTNASDGIAALVSDCGPGPGCVPVVTSEFSNRITDTFGGIDGGNAAGIPLALADNGAYHIISNDAHLGTTVTPDTETVDQSQNDNDGVTGFRDGYRAGANVSLIVHPTEDGFINVWIDSNNNGSFSDDGEHVITNKSVDAGDNSVTFTAPGKAGAYNVRFRYTTYEPDNMLPTGEALDGEVEDYQIAVPVIYGYASSGTEHHSVTNTDKTVPNTKTTNDTKNSPETILGSGECSANLIIHDFLKQGDRDGKYSSYSKKTTKEVTILQAHINRILAAQYKQAAGPTDGIFGKLTKQGVMRLQTALNEIIKPQPVLKIDGIVGPFTRTAINHSCGGM